MPWPEKVAIKALHNKIEGKINKGINSHYFFGKNRFERSYTINLDNLFTGLEGDVLR